MNDDKLKYFIFDLVLTVGLIGGAIAFLFIVADELCRR
jgi:hypothetical protein